MVALQRLERTVGMQVLNWRRLVRGSLRRPICTTAGRIVRLGVQKRVDMEESASSRCSWRGKVPPPGAQLAHMDAYDQHEIQALWERARKIRVPPKDSVQLTVPRSVLEDILQEDMKCPICLGTIESTLTVTTCLHRFCAECLERSLRVNLGPKDHHDCPSCRAKMASRRASKKDDRFDYLIDFLTIALGKRSRPSAAADASAAASSPRRRGAAEVDPADDFDLRQYRQAHQEKVEQFRARQSRSSASSSGLVAPPAAPKQRASAAKVATARPKENKVCLALFPSSEGSAILPLSMPFLKVPPLMQVGDVKQFLNLKLSFSKADYDLLEIYILHQGKTVILDDMLTISDVLMLYWDAASELRLYYRFYSAGGAGPASVYCSDVGLAAVDAPR